MSVAPSHVQVGYWDRLELGDDPARAWEEIIDELFGV